MLIDCHVLSNISFKFCCIFHNLIMKKIQLQPLVSLPQLYVFKSEFLRGCKSFTDPTLSIPPFEVTKSTSTIVLRVFVVPPYRSYYVVTKEWIADRVLRVKKEKRPPHPQVRFLCPTHDAYFCPVKVTFQRPIFANNAQHERGGIVLLDSVVVDHAC